LLFAEHGEVTAVAKVLGLDEAVIRRRLKELREKYALLTRHGRTLSLTDKGRSALPAIGSLLRQHAHLTDWLADRQERPRILSIATGSFGARFYVPRALGRFQSEHPDWQVQVQVRRGRERILGIAGGTYDLAVVSHDRAQITSLVPHAVAERIGLRIEPLAEHRLALVARKGTSFAQALGAILEAQTVPLDLLATFPFIGLDRQSGLRRQLEAHAVRGAKSPHFVIEAAGWEPALECARHGLGVAMLPLDVLNADDRQTLVIRLLNATITMRDSLLDPNRGAESSPAHEAMRAALKQAAIDHQTAIERRWAGVFF
jgi:DNA-binding transcriptional LysR family regulator